MVSNFWLDGTYLWLSTESEAGKEFNDAIYKLLPLSGKRPANPGTHLLLLNPSGETP
jgi:hypothetical protein